MTRDGPKDYNRTMEEHVLPLEGGWIEGGRRVSIAYKLVRRRNQKHIHIRITHAGELVVSASPRTSIARVEQALRDKAEWIDLHLERTGSLMEKFSPSRGILYRGEPLVVRIVRDSRRKGVVRLDKEQGILTVLCGDTGQDHVLSVMKRWLERSARAVLTERVFSHAASLGIPFAAVYIRNQKSRWGSSSSRGNISLNWRAVMLPPPVADYLVIHELAHQLHLNHSPRYWKAVETFCPDFRDHERWLKDHSTLLALFR